MSCCASCISTKVYLYFDRPPNILQYFLFQKSCDKIWRLFGFAPEGFPSGQRGQTVNLLAQPSEVRILPPPPYDFGSIDGVET